MVSRGWQIKASMNPADPPAIRLTNGDFLSLAAIFAYIFGICRCLLVVGVS